MCVWGGGREEWGGGDSGGIVLILTTNDVCNFYAKSDDFSSSNSLRSKSYIMQSELKIHHNTSD